MKKTIVSNVSKAFAGFLLACGVMVSPVLAKGGHGGGHGGGHHGGGHHGGAHHAHHPAGHHGGAHHGEHHTQHHGEHHAQHHGEHHGQHHDNHHADHRDHHNDRHIHYHYDHHHYYYGGGGGGAWSWLPAVWGWPSYVGPGYTNPTVNYTTVNNDSTDNSNVDNAQTDSPSAIPTDGKDLPPLNDRGVIRVLLPTPKAVVTFDGHKILGSRERRLIVTSPIEGDGPVKYQVHATWWQNGVQKHEVREGFVTAGGNVLADFTHPQPQETTFTQAPTE